MSHHAHWNRLRDLSQQRADACAVRLAEVTRALMEAQRKLDLLREYHREYLLRLAAAVQDGIHGDGLRNYRSFLANLEKAVEQQVRVVTQAGEARERVRLQWSAEQKRLESYRVLHNRTVLAAVHAERRVQQKQQDEFASRALPRFLTGAD